MFRVLVAAAVAGLTSVVHAGPLPYASETEPRISIHAIPLAAPDGLRNTSFTFTISFASTYNFLAYKLVDTEWQTPGLTDLTPGWEVVGQRGPLVAAEGPTRNNVGHTFHVTSVPFTMDLAAFNGDNVIAYRRWTYTGTNFLNSTVVWEPTRTEIIQFLAIPLPSAGLTGIAGLALIAVGRRRRLA